MYILSAGWGLISAAFLIPVCDITFSSQVEAHQRRRRDDLYRDWSMLPGATTEDVFFFGGKNYVQLFCRLTHNVLGHRTVFFNSKQPPVAPGCTLVPFIVKKKQNWHYQCVAAFIRKYPGLSV